MVTSAKYSSVKGLGPRYGRTIREKLGKIQMEQRKSHKCPYCHAVKVGRFATGIWLCNKCGVKFTSKAYTVSKVSSLQSAKEEM